MKFTFLTGLLFRIYTMREFTTKEDVLNTQKQVLLLNVGL